MGASLNRPNVQQHLWRCWVLWKWYEETKHWNPAEQRPQLFLRTLFMASKHLPNHLSSCCCSLLVGISVLRHPSLRPVLSVSFQTATVLSLGSGSGFLGSSDSSMALCLRISTEWSSILSYSQQYRNSKALWELCVWICTLGLICWVRVRRRWYEMT